MSLQVIAERLDKLLNASAGRIVLLSGGWGVGKTFQWVAAFNRHRATAPSEFARYAYVSMFGLGSVPEVRRRIAEEMVASIRLPGIGTIGDQIEPDGWKLKPLQLMKLLPVVPYLSKLEGLASELSFGAVRDAVICFDDLERASPQLRLADLLGLALFMKEQRNCRIVLLTTSEKLKGSDRQLWAADCRNSSKRPRPTTPRKSCPISNAHKSPWVSRFFDACPVFRYAYPRIGLLRFASFFLFDCSGR